MSALMTTDTFTTTATCPCECTYILGLKNNYSNVLFY